jgi:hypothetical protein
VSRATVANPAVADGFQHLSGFLSPAEVTTLLAEVAAERESFQRIDGRRGLGPRYEVLGGELVQERLPALVRLLRERIQPAISAFAGEPLESLPSPRRAMRVQIYTAREDGFRWHRDGHAYTALLTLSNESGGETQMLPQRLSRLLVPFLYALYPVPQVFSWLPRRSVRAAPGDLLVMRGRRLIHRGVTARAGERAVAVFAFERPGYVPHPLHDLIARRLNFQADAKPSRQAPQG